MSAQVHARHADEQLECGLSLWDSRDIARAARRGDAGVAKHQLNGLMLSTSRAGYEQRIIPVSGLLTCDNPKVILCSHSIGMGLVLAACDPVTRIAGLFHALLPEAQAQPARAKEKPGLFVDTGLEALEFTLKNIGAVPARLRYYAAGGAQVMGASGQINMGRRNTETLERLLGARGIRLTGAHLGGYACRSFYLALETGEASVLLSGQLNEISLCPPLMTS